MEERILTLNSIGAIKEAQIHLNGLAVIAGENDTGKSTVAKILMALIKAHNICKNREKINTYQKVSTMKEFNILLQNLFNRESIMDGKAEIIQQKNGENHTKYEVIIKDNDCVFFESNDKDIYFDATFIQCPFVWDFFDFFRQVRAINDNAKAYGAGARINYPYIFWDLYYKMIDDPLPITNKKLNHIKEKITKIINGFFLQDNETYKFYRNNQEISLKNVATGIKQLGILQVLLHKNRITPQGLFIFDEPENHLHPKWQLKFAEILIQLSALQIPIMVNSHSPNFIEAIYKYGLKYNVITHFHLASNGTINKHQDSNEKTLELIFEKLNEPFDTFEKLDFERLKETNKWDKNG